MYKVQDNLGIDPKVELISFRLLPICEFELYLKCHERLVKDLNRVSKAEKTGKDTKMGRQSFGRIEWIVAEIYFSGWQVIKMKREVGVGLFSAQCAEFKGFAP